MDSKIGDSDKIPERRYEMGKYRHDEDKRWEMKENDSEKKQKEQGI